MNTLEGKDNKLENKLENKSENKLESKSSELKRTKSARELEAEIGETRNAITEDIKAISDKVSPAALKQEAKQAWTGVKQDVADRANEAKDAAIDKVLEVKDVAVEKAQEVRDATIEKAEQVRDVVVEKAQQAGDAIVQTAGEASEVARRTGRAAWGFTVRNAVPLSLIGLGAGWLIANNRRQRGFRAEGYDSSYPRDVSYPAVGVEGSYPQTELYSTPAYEAYRPGSSVGESQSARRSTGASQTNGNGAASEKLQQTKQKLQQTVSQAEGKLRAGALRSKEVLQDRARRVAQSSRSFAEANPLALALGTLIAGVGVGLLLPSTGAEDRLLEPGRRRVRGLISEARDTTREVSGIVRDTAEETAQVLR